jgi:Txe/YoeB family toxin of Txe-Axe toxin-antitoxin module
MSIMKLDRGSRAAGLRRLRKLSLQVLENRSLMAGDLSVETLSGDVNGDGSVTALDVLQVINAIHAQSESRDVENFAALDVNQDGSISALDVLSLINTINNDRFAGLGRPEQQPVQTPLQDRIAERIADRDPTESLGGGAILDIAARMREQRGEREPIGGLRDLMQTAREDGEVTDEEKAEIRELVSTELAQRGRDGSNIDPERQTRRQERREERRDDRDGEIDTIRRDELRERLVARRDSSGATGLFRSR